MNLSVQTDGGFYLVIQTFEEGLWFEMKNARRTRGDSYS